MRRWDNGSRSGCTAEINTYFAAKCLKRLTPYTRGQARVRKPVADGDPLAVLANLARSTRADRHPEMAGGAAQQVKPSRPGLPS